MAYRVVKLTGTYYALEGDLNEIIEDAKVLVSEGTPVIIVDELEDLEALCIFDLPIMAGADLI